MAMNVGGLLSATITEAFLNEYYKILHKDPESAYGFYEDHSQIGRQDDNGSMTIITTLEAINEKILSIDQTSIQVGVLWVDTQDSIDGGISIMVTGFMLGMGKSSRNFVQVFFLAQKENGYYVLNDMLCFLDEVSPPAPRNDNLVAPTEIDAKEVPFVNEVPNVETVVDTEEVVPVEVVDEVPNVESAVDGDEVPLNEVVGEVPNVVAMVNAMEIPEVVDEVPNVIAPVTVADAEAVPLTEVVHEVPNVVTMVEGEEVPLLDAEAAPLVEIVIPNVETGVDREEVPLVETVDEIPNVDTMVDAERVPPAELVEEVPNVETVVNAEMAPHLEVVVETPNAEARLADAEVPLGNVVVDEVRDDSRVVEPNLVPLDKIAEELPVHSRMVESEPKMDEVPNKFYASTKIGETSSSQPEISSHLQSSKPAAEAAHDYSIYVKYLPISVTPSLLEEEFKRFGAIKSGGIQVKINKQGFCFGLVEFEEANSVKKALRASPVEICGRQIVVQEKHSSTPRVGRGAHRFRSYINQVWVGVGRRRWAGLRR